MILIQKKLKWLKIDLNKTIDIACITCDLIDILIGTKHVALFYHLIETAKNERWISCTDVADYIYRIKQTENKETGK